MPRAVRLHTRAYTGRGATDYRMKNTNDIAVLIVDDSALMRKVIGKVIEGAPGLSIAGKAMNGRFALDMLERVQPDVILLDLEMPHMNGLQFLEQRKRLRIDIPVIILSSIAKEGARVTMQCLELGASDFVTKPFGSESAHLRTVSRKIVDYVTAYGRRYKLLRRTRRCLAMDTPVERPAGEEDLNCLDTQERASLPSVCARAPARDRASYTITPTEGARQTRIVPLRESGALQIIAIGVSTGGPSALRHIFAQLDADLPQPVVVVQHMPAGFTREFAYSLNQVCALEVKEAQEGDLVRRGRVLIAPGDRHLTVERRSLATVAHINSDEPENGHRPSVDVLFESVARHFENGALGILMTGMGRDGAAQLARLYTEGSRTIAQDADSCIVYGMPRVACELGAVGEQVSLDDMAATINRYGKVFASS